MQSFAFMAGLSVLLALLWKDTLRANFLGRERDSSRTEGISLADVIPFETQFTRIVNDALRNPTNIAGGTIISTTTTGTYPGTIPIVDKVVWVLPAGSTSSGVGDLALIRELIQRKVDLTIGSGFAGTNFGTGSITAEFFTERIPPMSKTEIDIFLRERN